MAQKKGQATSQNCNCAVELRTHFTRSLRIDGNGQSQLTTQARLFNLHCGSKGYGDLGFFDRWCSVGGGIYFFPTELKPGTEVDCGSRVPLVSTGKYSVTIVVRSRRLMSSRERLV